MADAAQPGSGFEGFDFSTRGADYSASFGDLFAEVLTERGARQPSAQRGADLHMEMQVTFEESLSGGERAMTVTRRDHCHVCAGSGRTRSSTGPCHVCQGTGAVRSVRGQKGRWYREISSNPEGALNVENNRIPVRATHAPMIRRWRP